MLLRVLVLLGSVMLAGSTLKAFVRQAASSMHLVCMQKLCAKLADTLPPCNHCCACRTVLVDDTPLAFLHQPANGVPVLGFRGDPDDRLLMEAVLPLLQVGTFGEGCVAQGSGRFEHQQGSLSCRMPRTHIRAHRSKCTYLKHAFGKRSLFLLCEGIFCPRIGCILALESILCSHSAGIHGLPSLSRVSCHYLLDRSMIVSARRPSSLRGDMAGSAVRQPLCMAFMRSRRHDLSSSRPTRQVSS